MHIIIFLLIFFKANLILIQGYNYTLSSKVLIWNEHIKIFKCPIHTIEEFKDHIDPSILIFKSKQATELLETTHDVIVANQTDYLTHNVKAFATFNEFTFAYASMAQLEDLFDHVEIHNQPGYFEQKNYSNFEYIPEDEIIAKLRNQSSLNKNGIIELGHQRIYKCMGAGGRNDPLYLLLESSNITANLKVGDIVFGDRSDGFLETISQIDEIDVSMDEKRWLVETGLADCSIKENQDLIETKLKNLINLENSELNCKGGFSSNSSLYVIKPNSYMERLHRQNSLINSLIIGRYSHRFAYRIISVKKIGKYYLFETSDTLYPNIRTKRGWFKRIFRRVVNVIRKIASMVLNFKVTWNWNLKTSFTAPPMKKHYDLTLENFTVDNDKSKTIKIGEASVTLILKPTINVFLSMQASLAGIHISRTGIILDINANLNAKLNLNTMSIDYDWPENAIVPMRTVAVFWVPVGPVVLPGTINTGVFSQHGLKILTRTGIHLNAEAEYNYDFHFPFIYNRFGPPELPTAGSVKKSYSFFRVTSDFSEQKNEPTLLYRYKIIPKANAVWPDIGNLFAEIFLKVVRSFIPNWLGNWIIEKLINGLRSAINNLQLIATTSLPLVTTASLALCSQRCSKNDGILITNNYYVAALNLNFRAPFINLNSYLPSNGQPILSSPSIDICLPIPLKFCPLNYPKLCSSSSMCAYPQLCASTGANVGTCVACNSNTDCKSSTQPICSSVNTCEGCISDSQCLATNFNTPYCYNTGKCVRCRNSSDCGGNTPTCAYTGANLGMCVACNSNTDCKSSIQPICSSVNTCEGCISDSQCLATNFNTPYCIGGECGRCRNSFDCAGNTPVCINKSCFSCSSNAQCSAKNSNTPSCASSGECISSGGGGGGCSSWFCNIIWLKN